MMRSRAAVAAFASLVLTVTTTWAKSDDQVRQQFAQLLGSGRYARIVWTKGGPDSWHNLEDLGRSTVTRIYACDTRDGVRRPLNANLPTGHLVNPSLTRDGRRVVFCVGNTRQVYVCDFDGDNLRMVTSGYQSFGTWQAPDGSHWVIGDGNGGVYRINIDNPSERVLLRATQGIKYATLSQDGTLLAGGFPSWPNAGVYHINEDRLLLFSPSGCWPSFSFSDNNKIMYTIEPHTHIKIVDAEGNRLLVKNIADGILPGGEYNSLRWSNDDDIIAHWAEGNSSHMPIVQRISTTEWVSLYDDATDFNAFAHVFVYSGSISDTTFNPDTSDTGTVGGNAPPEVYAGADTTITQRLTTSFFLSATVRDDGEVYDNPVITWTQRSGPATADISSPSTENTSVRFPLAGTYTFRITADDGEYRVYDDVTVTVRENLPLAVLRPVPGEQVRIDSAYTIRWQMEPPEGVVVYVSMNDGETYQSLVNQAVGEGGPTEWVWHVPANTPPSTTCRIRIEHYIMRDEMYAESGPFSLVSERSAPLKSVGTPISSVTAPTGGGSTDIGIIRDDVYPSTGTYSDAYDTYDGDVHTQDYFGYTFDRTYRLASVRYHSGAVNDRTDGGTFQDVVVQVRSNGTWTAVESLASVPAYPGTGAEPFTTYTFTFTPQEGDGIRIVGAPGDGTWVSCAELDVYGTAVETVGCAAPASAGGAIGSTVSRRVPLLVFDVSGRLVARSYGPNAVDHLSGVLPPGCYFVKRQAAVGARPGRLLRIE
ncbi:MAG: hypothetical protein GF331_09710 [Chitinivibrionales bacterium]|nr:hypothetical protein [Chitinivibrionales bacterium]